MWWRSGFRGDSDSIRVGVLAVVFREVADRPVDLVLFSGQSSMPAIVAESSGGVLLLVFLVKDKGAPILTPVS